SYQEATQLQGTSLDVKLDIGDNVMLHGAVCKNRPPFDDVRVRQALNYAMDRDALNKAVYNNLGAPMWGFWKEGAQYYDPAVKDYYKYDPNKAKQLLAAAGQSNLTFDSYFTPGVSDRAAEVFQAQLAQIGVTMNIKPLTSTGDFFPDAKGAAMNF